MAWRKAPGPPPGSAEAQIGQILGQFRDWRDVVAAESWLAMLRSVGGDPEVGELFVAFAREAGHGVA